MKNDSEMATASARHTVIKRDAIINCFLSEDNLSEITILLFAFDLKRIDYDVHSNMLLTQWLNLAEEIHVMRFPMKISDSALSDHKNLAPAFIHQRGRFLQVISAYGAERKKKKQMHSKTENKIW